MRYIMGIDPGSRSGGIAFITTGGSHHVAFSMKKMTEKDISELIVNWSSQVMVCYIEKVGVMPKQSVIAARTFMIHYGFLRGCVSTAGIKWNTVIPYKWQKNLSCLTKGDKNVSKAKAQQLFPKIEITHDIADALLIAEYGRRQEAANSFYLDI